MNFDDIKLSDLLLGFLKFYDGFHQKKIKVDISKQEIRNIDSSEPDYVFSIEDPFDRMHNPGDRPRLEFP